MTDVTGDRFVTDTDRALRLIHNAVRPPQPSNVIPFPNRTTTAAAGTRLGDSRRRPQKEEE